MSHSINKNISLHRSLPLNIIVPSFDGAEERYEWVIYQLNCLYSLLDDHLRIHLRTHALSQYVDYSRKIILNELLHIDGFSITEKQKIKTLLDHIHRVIRDIKSLSRQPE